MKMLQRMGTLMLAVMLLSAVLGTAQAEDAAAIQSGDILCFGIPDAACGFDGRWLVLDARHSSMGTEGLFLVSLGLIGDEDGGPLLFRQLEGDVSVSFSDRGENYAAAYPGVTDYPGSDLQQWSEDFLLSHFSLDAQAALLPTFQSDEAITIPGLGIPLPGAGAGTVDFDPAENVLAGDRLFPLSVAEVTNTAYGFTDNRSRVALYKGEAAGYWLRSPHVPTFPLDVGFVFPFGAVMDYPVNARSLYTLATYARPACNLDSAKISALEALATTVDGKVWRVTFDGEPANQQTYDTALPVVGNVLDLNRMITLVLVAAVVLLAALIALVVWLIVRHRKRR